MKDNLKEERLLILHMIHEGKISSEEGSKLLESIKFNAEDEYQGIDMEDKINKFSTTVDSFAKDVGSKIGTAFKDAEPKIKKATKKALEKTALVMEDISKSLNESIKSMEEKESKSNSEEDTNVTDLENSSAEDHNDDDNSKLS